MKAIKPDDLFGAHMQIDPFDEIAADFERAKLIAHVLEVLEFLGKRKEGDILVCGSEAFSMMQSTAKQMKIEIRMSPYLNKIHMVLMPNPDDLKAFPMWPKE